MAFELPLTPSLAHYTFRATIDSSEYSFEFRWNGRDSAWYMSIYESDETPIISGVKVLIGVLLGRRGDHDLFKRGAFVVQDMANEDRDATFDDLGTRVVVRYYTDFELVSLVARAASL